MIKGVREAGDRMRWLDGIIASTGMSLSKLRETVEGRESRCAAVYGGAKSWTPTKWLNNKNS